MAIITKVLRKSLTLALRGKSHDQIAEYFLLALQQNSQGIIADFEKGESLEQIKKKWLQETE